MVAGPCDPQLIDTVIFVDVDGVLNVGARDQDDYPLLFNQSNVGYAVARRGRSARSRTEQDCVDKLLSVSEREIGRGEAATYMKFVCVQESHVSEVLAARLAAIVEKSGEGRSVVLSSNWRRPQHAKKVQQLEMEVSKHLGSSFHFDARTKQVEEKRAGDRLRCIGDYLEDLCRARDLGKKPLKVLVLEDFFITPLDGWECDGMHVHSAMAAEAYLRGRAPNQLEVKLVHTYDEWKTSSGLRVQIGAGLTQEHLEVAEAFLARATAAEASEHERWADCLATTMPWLSLHMPEYCFLSVQ